MALKPGQTLASYQILVPLGAGAMGEVYRARDAKLGREVAIKVLPEHFASDEERLKRFEREAKTLASLNHPNVAQIFAVDQVGDTCFLVLELVEGETLEDRLKRGPLPLAEALDVCRQIAEGLEAAHEAGVIHRDLKPANVRITTEGKVKVIDFGLAKPAREAGDTQSSTDSVLSTEAGRLLGTPTYMAPEQARGKAIDKRVDVWAFGCVLYECLTAKRAFTGETLTDVFAAVIEREPEWTALPPATPQAVRHLLVRCLAKDRRARLHDIADARIEVEAALADSGDVTMSLGDSGRPIRARSATLLAVVALVAAGAGWFAASRRAGSAPSAPAERRSLRLSIPSRSAEYDHAQRAAISPDGRSVLFRARSNADGRWSLWLRPLDSFAARSLPDTVEATEAFWSWDGRSIAFHADGKLWRVDVEQGGSRHLIAAIAENLGATWGRQGVILLSRGEGGIVRIPAEGGTPEPITTPDPKFFEAYDVQPTFLPDGNRFLFIGLTFDPGLEVQKRRLYAGRLDSKETVFVGNLNSAAHYVSPGWLVHLDEDILRAVPFDADSLRVSGEAVPIEHGVFFFRPLAIGAFSVSDQGDVAFESTREKQTLVWVDPNGVRQGSLGSDAWMTDPRISPDGTQVAVVVIDPRTKLSDIWLRGVSRPTSTHLTQDPRWEGYPVWSRDGSLVYFSWEHAGLPGIYAIRSDGTGEIRKVYRPESGVWFTCDPSPDGRHLLIFGGPDAQSRHLRILTLDGSAEPVDFRPSSGSETAGRFSPDGRWIAYDSNETGRDEVYLAPFQESGPKVLVSDNGGSWPVWAPDGKRLYFMRPSAAGAGEPKTQTLTKLMVVDLDEPASLASPPAPRVLLEYPDNVSDFDVTPDGKRFLLSVSPEETPPIQVILNALPERR